ncbi:hypothetical protein CB1_000305021 [Camelus ferus]|nr:hypothetical protein CB1_000305021 [Camelus ferus]
MFISFVVWCGGSTVLLLLRHHRRVQHSHTPNRYHTCPPETRAAHTVLMLTVTFVIFHVLDSVFAFYVIALVDTHLWLMQTSHILASCFPTISPFLLILQDPRVLRSCP